MATAGARGEERENRVEKKEQRVHTAVREKARDWRERDGVARDAERLGRAKIKSVLYNKQHLGNSTPLRSRRDRRRPVRLIKCRNIPH